MPVGSRSCAIPCQARSPLGDKPLTEPTNVLCAVLIAESKAPRAVEYVPIIEFIPIVPPTLTSPINVWAERS